MTSLPRNNSKIIGTIAFFLILIVPLSVYSFSIEYKEAEIVQLSSNISKSVDEYSNLTVEEAWTMLTDPSPSNGIQIPVDVRRDSEWRGEHIDTPFPENPVHYPLSLLEDQQGLQDFISLFNGKEIIIYCRSGARSFSAVKILVNSNFTGKIYNMAGGILAWNEANYPTIGNQPPGPPTITGPTNGRFGQIQSYTFLSIDPDGDTVSYCVNWNDSSGEICYGPYPSGQTISLNHTWEEKGTYLIQVKAQDKYGDESNWTTLEVSMPKNTFAPFRVLSCFLHFLFTGFYWLT